MIGKYEREALEQQRDALLQRRAQFGLSPMEGMQLDRIQDDLGSCYTGVEQSLPKSTK